MRVSVGVLVIDRAEVHREFLSRLHEKIALRLPVLGLVGPETQPTDQPRQHRARRQAGDQCDPFNLARALGRPEVYDVRRGVGLFTGGSSIVWHVV